MKPSVSGTVRPPFGDPPVGAVMPFAGALGTPVPATASPPDASAGAAPYVTAPLEAWGWMLCDGRALDTVAYRELFVVLGYLYGGSGGSFHIPDYRGAFLRGTDLGAGIDPDTSMRKSPTGAGYDGVGSVQPCALQDHEHGFTIGATPGEGSTVSAFAPEGQPGQTGTVEQNPPHSPHVGVSAQETRPANVAVNFIIKFTYGLRPFPGRWPSLREKE